MHIKTLHGSDYYFAPTIPQILLIHPTAAYLLDLAEQGIELEKWINQLDEKPVEIEAGIKVTKRNQGRCGQMIKSYSIMCT
jgi:hypothetical protein